MYMYLHQTDFSRDLGLTIRRHLLLAASRQASSDMTRVAVKSRRIVRSQELLGILRYGVDCCRKM